MHGRQRKQTGVHGNQRMQTGVHGSQRMQTGVHGSQRLQTMPAVCDVAYLKTVVRYLPWPGIEQFCGPAAYDEVFFLHFGPFPPPPTPPPGGWCCSVQSYVL